VIYPGSSPEFRVLVKADGSKILQVRYVHGGMGYKSKWQDIPVVKENDTTSTSSTPSNV
jgi:hypothetical protein